MHGGLWREVAILLRLRNRVAVGARAALRLNSRLVPICLRPETSSARAKGGTSLTGMLAKHREHGHAKKRCNSYD
jgi:hypothetical protein